MAQRIEWRIEIDVVTVTNDSEGYETPLTAVTSSPTYGTKTLLFATNLDLGGTGVTGYERCVETFTLNTPELKAGLGLASRHSATITFLDFVGDPDPFSPAVQANPDTVGRGSYFGKLNARHLMVNRPIRITGVSSGSPDYEFELLTTELKQISSDKWQLTCRDVLYRLEDKKTTFPKSYSANVTNSPGLTGTTINLNGAASNWDATKHVAVSGTDIIPISSVSGTTSTTLNVTRPTTLVIGSRTYVNEREELQQSESVFRGRKYESATLTDIIVDIFEDAGITNANYTLVDIQNELDDWVGVQDIDCLFHEPKPAVDVLNMICQTFLIDIYTTPDNQIKVSSTSPWQGTTTRFFEGREITYGKGTITISDDLRFSRALLSYGLLNQADDTTYKANSFKFNSEYESSVYYDEEKLFNFENNNILSIKTRDKEIAETTTVRFVNRWAFRPLVADIEINKAAFDQIEIGDTLFIEHSQLQDVSGKVSSSVRYQVVKLQPLQSTFYRMKAISFAPYLGTNDGFTFDPLTGELTAVGPITVNQDIDLNLFLEAGSPEPSAQLTEYTFIVDNDIIGAALGVRIQNASLIIGDGWASTGITFNIVCLNGVTLTANGGNGGTAGNINQNGFNGQDGGTSIRCKSGQTINIYLSGSRTVQGVMYTCDGYLYAPGGGGGGGGGANSAGTDVGEVGAGGGGAGYPIGKAGLFPDGTVSGATIATLTTGATGEQSLVSGGDGGDSGFAGTNGDNNGSTSGGIAGQAGKAIVLDTGTVNLYGAGRFIQGSGDAPSAIIP